MNRDDDLGETPPDIRRFWRASEAFRAAGCPSSGPEREELFAAGAALRRAGKVPVPESKEPS